MNMDDSLPALLDLPADRLTQRRVHLLAGIGRDEQRRRAPLGVPQARPLRVAAVCLAAAVLLAAPAYAIVHALFPPSVPPLPVPVPASGATVHVQTTYDGEVWAVETYSGPDGRLCVADGNVTSPGTGCWVRSELFKNGPVWVDGPGALHSANSPPTTWDRMWVAGIAQAKVKRLDVVMTDCSLRSVRLDGDGVFLLTVPRADLRADVWPYALIAYDTNGRSIWQQHLHTFRPNETPAPSPAPRCS